MQDKVADYEKILRDIQARVSDADAEMIRATLDRVSTPLVDSTLLTQTGFST